MNETYTELMKIIRLSLWGQGGAYADDQIYQEICAQALSLLPANALSKISMDDSLRKRWKREIYRQILCNVNYLQAQKEIPLQVPYAILKGTSAARYYPNPLYRTLGDIDIMTRHSDYDAACAGLLKGGYREVTGDFEKRKGRHREFVKNGIEIEVHSFYARRNSRDETELLDRLITENMTSSHDLPDMINGLVLIEHINYHIEGGIGLRHIIDWMMFADQCLTDDKWPEFQALAQKTGHEKLALIATRMCEIYLGLPEHQWCAGVDSKICGQFMHYILESGNFGEKKEMYRAAGSRFLTNTRTLRGTLRVLQRRGAENWKFAQKHRFFLPFSWIYQLFRYLFRGINREHGIRKIVEDYKEAKEKNKLFDALGVARDDKKLVYYRDGEYKME